MVVSLVVALSSWYVNLPFDIARLSRVSITSLNVCGSFRLPKNIGLGYTRSDGSILRVTGILITLSRLVRIDK